MSRADGSVLGRTRTSTVGSASAHFPHPDGSYMGLTVGEGHEDSPSLWGHWNGTDLSFERIEGVLLQDVSPSGCSVSVSTTSLIRGQKPLGMSRTRCHFRKTGKADSWMPRGPLQLRTEY